MEAQREQTRPSGIRWPRDLRIEIEQEAAAEERTFSQEVRFLVKIGLEKRKNLDLTSGQAAETAEGLRQLAAREGAGV